MPAFTRLEWNFTKWVLYDHIWCSNTYVTHLYTHPLLISNKIYKVGRNLVWLHPRCTCFAAFKVCIVFNRSGLTSGWLKQASFIQIILHKKSLTIPVVDPEKLILNRHHPSAFHDIFSTFFYLLLFISWLVFYFHSSFWFFSLCMKGPRRCAPLILLYTKNWNLDSTSFCSTLDQIF